MSREGLSSQHYAPGQGSAQLLHHPVMAQQAFRVGGCGVGGAPPTHHVFRNGPSRVAAVYSGSNLKCESGAGVHICLTELKGREEESAFFWGGGNDGAPQFFRLSQVNHLPYAAQVRQPGSQDGSALYPPPPLALLTPDLSQ